MKTLWMKPALAGIMTLMLGLCLHALPVSAGTGIGIVPSSVDIADALRGSEYESTLRIYTGDERTDYSVAVETGGQASGWVSLTYKGKPVERITVLPGNPEEIQVKVSVPQDAANNKYSAKVLVTSIPSPVSGGGQAIAAAAYATLNIGVSGTQRIDGKVNGISADDPELGYPLRIKIYFENNGNVGASPLIDVSIRQGANTVANFSKNETKVGPGKGQFIDVEWDTTGKAPANYDCRVAVSLDGKKLAEKDLSFKILPLGELTRSGQIKHIEILGNPSTDSMLKVIATFANTGQIDSWAELNSEVYLATSLVQVVKSEKLLVQKGSETDLVAYFTPKQAGAYTLKGYVLFEGKKTELVEKSITIVPMGNPSTGDKRPVASHRSVNVLYPAIVCATIIAISAVALLSRKQRRKQFGSR